MYNVMKFVTHIVYTLAVQYVQIKQKPPSLIDSNN